MTVLSFGLHHYESQKILLRKPECSPSLLTQREHQKDHMRGYQNPSQ